MKARPFGLLRLQDRRAGVLARGRDHRLGAEETRRHHDLVAEHEVVDDQVMAVDLPAPRLGGRWRPHHGDVIEPLAIRLEIVVVQFAQRVIELHDVAAQRQPAGAERGAQQAEGGLTLGRRHLGEADTGATVEMLVHPAAPLGIVDVERGALALLRRERGEEGRGGLLDRRRGDAGRLHAEQSRHDGAVGSHALERVGEAFRFETRATASSTRRCVRPCRWPAVPAQAPVRRSARQPSPRPRTSAIDETHADFDTCRDMQPRFGRVNYSPGIADREPGTGNRDPG